MDRLIPGPPRGRGRPAGDAQPPTGNAPAGSDLPSQREIEEQAKVWTLKDGIPVPIPVEVGLSEGGFTEVSADTLSEGLSVIVRKQAPRS